MGQKSSKDHTETSTTLFTCPFCKRRMTCYVKMNYSKAFGKVKCRRCKKSYKKAIGITTTILDVVLEWKELAELV